MAKNWYPVINLENCITCGACVNKCPNGVYEEKKAPSPVVVHPEDCIDHCHGCGNLCPQGAITYFGDDTGWTPPNAKAGEDACECGYAGKCQEEKQTLDIEFLYLDLVTCERCMATDRSLVAAIKELRPVLETLGYEVSYRKIEIRTEDMAEDFRFRSSPTIRVNGQDICGEAEENSCSDCSELCGDDVECRVFEYRGKQYEQPPKAMLIDRILNHIYRETDQEQTSYELPENLKKFFRGKQATQSACNCGCDCGSSCQ